MNGVRILTPAEETTYAPNGATLWQSRAWAHYQRSLGREVRIYAGGGASALVVIDRTAGGFSTWDLPRGPLWTHEKDLSALLEAIIPDAKNNRCIELTLSAVTPLPAHGLPFTVSARHVQPQATRVLDIGITEDVILSGMHQKGRYNISVARKSGVSVRQGSSEDLDAFYALLKATGGRDGFTIAQQSHYARFLSDLGGSFLLIAEHEGKAIGGLLGVIHGTTGIYYYGASSYAHRSLMAPYLLQWEAIRRAKSAGCTHYDLLGVSPENAPYEDPWRGITDFKRKFGGAVISYPPEQTLVLRPTVKMLLGWKRRILG